MMKHPYLFLLLALHYVPLHAQEIPICVNTAQSQADINECSTQRYKAADAFLNRSYREVIANLNPKQQEKLKEAQRAWISFRDSNCEAQSFDYAKGSLYTHVYNDCLTTVTQIRNDELRRVYLKQENSSGIPAQNLVGVWYALEGSYGLEVTFGIDAGIHHYVSHLNNIPYEAGQWQLSNDHLSIIDKNGKILHNYVRVELDNTGVLSLYEHDGGTERYKKKP
jgi:uncharacterized protein YecT (DUF1311 family)